MKAVILTKRVSPPCGGETPKDGGQQRNFTSEHFWARGYFVSTVGIDEEVIGQYIRQQEDEDRRIDQLRLL